MTTSRAPRPVGTCVHARQIETPFVTELVAALGHLKSAAQLAGTPAALLLRTGDTITEQQMSIWVAMNASHLLVHLDEITDRPVPRPLRWHRTRAGELSQRRWARHPLVCQTPLPEARGFGFPGPPADLPNRQKPKTP
ncbi:hypothetical protein AB0M94_36235 [Streptomyces xanthochromogenes]|uniref:hypothetical protein n=1 Tax=Streptomyces xanthochromogenes TaxID=67384 RepID=UPI0034294A32